MTVIRGRALAIHGLVPGLVLGWAALVVLRHSWAGDMRLHLATLHGLLRDPWAPMDPLVGAVPGSPYYSPYMVALAAVARLTGLRPLTVLELAGLGNLALWLWALARFCRGLGGPPVAALAVVFSLLLWGVRPHEWSGFLGLYSLSWTMAYPSLFATALMLLAWREYLEARWLRLVPLLALIVLVHPFTALNTLLGLLAFALARPNQSGGRPPGPRGPVRPILASLRSSEPVLLRAWQQYAAGAAALALALAWPWSQLSSVLGATEGLSWIHHRLVLDLGADYGFRHYGLALAGLPALITGVNRRPLGRELMLLFTLAISVVGLGAALGSYGLARALPVAMLPLHLALASYLGTARWDVRKAAYAAVTAVACAVGLYGNSGGLIRAWWEPVSPQTLRAWKSRDPHTVYTPLLRKVRPGMVVLGDRSWTGRLVNEKGAYSVVPGWPYPFVDEAARRRDVRRFLAPGTSEDERMRIADRYRVDCLMLSRRHLVPVREFRIRARAGKGRVLLLCRLSLPAMSAKSSWAGASGLLLICASVGLGAYACLLGPSNTVPVSGGGWSLEADPSALLIVWLTFSMVGLGALGVCLGLLGLRWGWRPPARWLLWGGLLATLLLALVPVGGSTDVQSYALYGRMGALGLDPYHTVPQALIDAKDAVAAYSPKAWRNTSSVYGPIANWTFAAAASLAGASMFKIVFLLKLAAGAAFALVALVLHRIARDPVRVHLLWTCNPLMLWACVAGAHVDVYGAAVMVLAFAVFLRPPSAPQWMLGVYAGALIGIAGGVKAPFFLAGLGLAWVARGSRPALAGLAGGVVTAGVGSYLLAGPAGFATLLDKSEDVSPTNPWRYFPRWGFDMPNEEMSRWGYAAGLVVLLVLLWRLTPARDRTESAARVAFAVCAALLLASPVQHPWYDPLIFPLLALMPPTRIDGLTQWRLAAGSIGFLPGVPRFTGEPWPDPMPFVRDPVNNWWVSAALGVVAILMVLVLLPPGRRAPKKVSDVPDVPLTRQRSRDYPRDPALHSGDLSSTL